MKKRILIVGLSAILCMLCGCLEATPLTEKEMDVVAEYAASLLLKYDKHYATPLYYAEELEVRLTPTPTPTPTPKPVGATPIPKEESGSSSGNGFADSSPTTVPTLTPAPYDHEETTKQLTEIIAVENITVSCKGYQLMKSVESTEYFSLVAKDGRQYIVVDFLLHNNTNEDQVFDASENGLEYSIDINIDTVSRVSLSMLSNDLQYMEIPVPANGTAEAVLVFEVAEGEPETIHLIIEDESENTVFVKLK